jgi:hypothetical protein
MSISLDFVDVFGLHCTWIDAEQLSNWRVKSLAMMTMMTTTLIF